MFYIWCRALLGDSAGSHGAGSASAAYLEPRGDLCITWAPLSEWLPSAVLGFSQDVWKLAAPARPVPPHRLLGPVPEKHNFGTWKCGICRAAQRDRERGGKKTPSNAVLLQGDSIYLSSLHLSCQLVPRHRHWTVPIPTRGFSQVEKGPFVRGKPFQQQGWRPGEATGCLISVRGSVQGSSPTSKPKIWLSGLSDSSSKPRRCSQTRSQVTAYLSFSAQ